MARSTSRDAKMHANHSIARCVEEDALQKSPKQPSWKEEGVGWRTTLQEDIQRKSCSTAQVAAVNLFNQENSCLQRNEEAMTRIISGSRHEPRNIKMYEGSHTGPSIDRSSRNFPP